MRDNLDTGHVNSGVEKPGDISVHPMLRMNKTTWIPSLDYGIPLRRDV